MFKDWEAWERLCLFQVKTVFLESPEGEEGEGEEGEGEEVDNCPVYR